MSGSHDLSFPLPDAPTLPALAAGPTTLSPLGFAERYAAQQSLAAGGMGQILVARDAQIGRDIALKRMLSRTGDSARFVREARIQAQLEHPAIVPVYDLGLDEDGQCWFTMKQVRGTTLADVLQQLRAGSTAAQTRFTRRRLLTAFSSVCMAVDYAHARGVIHRDLKPANIMLGDFGEVYVLDWGIARVRGVADLPADAGSETDDDADLRTQVGQVIGTIGYMPPEQLLGDVERIGPATDVWALGAILFELLSLERLHPRQTLGEAIAAIDDPLEVHPSSRSPREQVPPELDAICARALAQAPEARWPSARALNEAIERYLDGDRDLQRRRELASEHLARAELEAARSFEDSPAAIEAHARAMQEAGQAIALDPLHPEASTTLVRLLMTPPARIPDEARDELRATDHAAMRVTGRFGALGMLAMYMFLPIYLWMGIRDWTTAGFVIAAIAIAAVFSALSGSRPAHAGKLLLGVAVAFAVIVGALCRVASPFILAPTLALAGSVTLTLHPTRPPRVFAITLVALPLTIPLALEAAGLLAPSVVFENGALHVQANMTALPTLPTTLMLVLAPIGTAIALVLYVAALRDTLQRVQEQLHLHTWNLRQLVPTRVATELRRSPPHRRGSPRA